MKFHGKYFLCRILLHFNSTKQVTYIRGLFINITHQIPSQNKTKSKLQTLKNRQKSKFEILQSTLHVTHLLKLLDKMYKYAMDPTRNVGPTERTWYAGRTEGQTDRRTDGVKPIYPPPPPPTTSLCEGYNYRFDYLSMSKIPIMPC